MQSCKIKVRVQTLLQFNGKQYYEAGQLPAELYSRSELSLSSQLSSAQIFCQTLKKAQVHGDI